MTHSGESMVLSPPAGFVDNVLRPLDALAP
jgi:hypothetical protein